MAIKVGDLSKAIANALAEYTENFKEEVARATDDISKAGVKRLKAKSPKDSGEYAKGWTRKKTPNGFVLRNKVYQLTHLLEHGHAKVNGGRVPAKVHIRPVEEQIIKEFESRIEKAAKS